MIKISKNTLDNDMNLQSTKSDSSSYNRTMNKTSMGYIRAISDIKHFEKLSTSQQIDR